MMSFSLTFAPAFDLASQIVNDLMPAYLIPIGVSLALLVLGAVTTAFRWLKVRRI